MEFIYKKRGHSPEKKRLWVERNHILKPDKTRIVGKGKDSEHIQEYRPNQSGRKRIAELNIEIYNRFFQLSERRLCGNINKITTSLGYTTTNRMEKVR